jgi:hypothetical protein
MSDQIPAIPAATTLAQLVIALNDRIRRINVALGGSGGSDSSPAASVSYGTHRQRLTTSAKTAADASLWFEADRNNVEYQAQNNVWAYAGGAMAAAIASRPADLGATDKGFLFLATDTFQEFQWSGSAWVEVTQGNLAQVAYGASALSLSGSFGDIPGCTLTLTRAGRHIIFGCFDFNGAGVGDVNQQASGQLLANGSAQSGMPVYNPLVWEVQGSGVSGSPVVVGNRATVFQQWAFTASAAGQVVLLQAQKSGGTGTSKADVNSSIAALWIGP